MIVERPSLERRILASLDASRIPVLLGGCGSGRTSALLRVANQLRPNAQYLDFAAAATTPERCLAAVIEVSQIHPPDTSVAPASARAAFEALLAFFDATAQSSTAPVTFLLDDVLDIRTFESFPGLRHVQRELIAKLAVSPARFVLASRFTARMHRLLRDAPSRFEVMHVPALDTHETSAIALQLGGGRREWPAEVAPAVTALAAGRPAYATMLLDTLATLGPAIDPVAALAALFAPDGRLTARCRECYEFRLHRARGYGALKAILGVLAAAEPLTLTEIAHLLRRTPGSTKDYLSWLEDVDLVRSQGKRYSFDDPLLRLFVRIYGRPVPPTDAVIVHEVGGYAKRAITPAREIVVPVAAGAAGENDRVAQPIEAGSDRGSGIIEID